MNQDIFDIRDRVVVITGGAGQLGSEFCRTLLERGAKVASLDTTTSGVPDGTLSLATDVTERTSIESALRDIESTLGAPHALINAAAIDSPPNAPIEENGPFETFPDASLDRVLDVNVKGVIHACQVIGGRMAQLGRGSIVNISSIYGLVSPDQRVYEYRRQSGENYFKPIAYAASKSALFNVTRYLATYFAPKGVRVNTLTLGGVLNNQDERFVAAYTARVPLGRMAAKTEYNGAVVFLISDASAYMTGSNLILDGGWTAW